MYLSLRGGQDTSTLIVIVKVSLVIKELKHSVVAVEGI
jgi:hypothetical protein